MLSHYAMNEEYDLLHFKTNSPALKILRQLALTYNDYNMQMNLKEIDDAKDFDALLSVSDKLDPAYTNEEFVKKIGTLGVKTIFSIGGFFNNTVNYAYYLLALRSEAIAYMADKGYMRKQSFTPKQI